MKRKIIKGVSFALFALTALLNLLEPSLRISIPIGSANEENWDRNSYWAYPWGESGVHRGIDKFWLEII